MMKHTKLVVGIVAMLWTVSSQVCAAQQIYSLPNTAGSAQWVKIGSFNAIEQGQDVEVQLVSSYGYNASYNQDQVSYIQFKTSNGGSVDGNGFGGDSWWYTTGPNTAAPSAIKWVANAAGNAATSFTLYAYFAPFTGTDSFYTVSNPPGNYWTNYSVGGQTDPGGGSSTVLIATNQMFIGSNTSFASNVGIGTTAPAYKLDVAGQIRSSSGGIVFPDGSTQATAYNPSTNLSIAGAVYSQGILSSSISSVSGGQLSLLNPSKTAAGTALNWTIFNMTGAYGNSLQFWDYDTIGCASGGMCSNRFTLMDNGNVGIGTPSPGAKLEVDGNVKLTSGSGASITFQDGTVQSTAYTGVTCGGDYAESVDVIGSRTSYEPGDVLVIGANSGSDVAKSAEPYSTLVAGIYSTRPGTVGRRQITDPKISKTEVPMAMMGIVPTKVSTENGPIKRGDLLVTSSTVAYAMKGTDRSRMLGAVIGKAMGNLDSGIGVIEVLVTLQ
jgi:hypothetical protein